MRIEKLVLQGCQVVVVELELELERAKGHPPAALQHGQGVVEDLLEGHGRSPPPRWRAPQQLVRSSKRRRGMVRAARVYQVHGGVERKITRGRGDPATGP